LARLSVFNQFFTREPSPDYQGPQPLISIQSQRHARWLWGFFEGVPLKKSVPLAFFWPWDEVPQEKRAIRENGTAIFPAANACVGCVYSRGAFVYTVGKNPAYCT
jgi:hypothetical protein